MKTLNRVKEQVSTTPAIEKGKSEEVKIHTPEIFSYAPCDTDAFGILVEGDSMQPNYQEGTTLIVMPSREPRNGCLVVSRHKKHGVIFRMFNLIADNCIRLSADNPIYPPYEGSPEDFCWIYPVHSTIKNEW